MGVVVGALALASVLFSPHAATAGPGASLSSAVLASASAPNHRAALSLGRTLFDENCSSCHGVSAQGSALGPNLRGLGAGTVDLWVSSGWMPLANPAIQPIRKPALFDRAQTTSIAQYVASLAPGGLPIPKVDLAGANSAEGFSVFALNCAPCHTVTGAGDALADGLSAPSLHGVTATQVAEAVRTGPGNMPRFSTFTISPTQLTDVVDYVTKHIEHPSSPGGLSLGGVGPVAEGFVGLFVGVGVCVLIALWIGDRNEREDTDGHGDAHSPPGGEPPSGSEPEVAHA
ncbi:MAG: c-type cytochrome [Actinomycetota bacterium]|nr:c-type cytochrome [Actinomycetota bacterium]